MSLSTFSHDPERRKVKTRQEAAKRNTPAYRAFLASPEGLEWKARRNAAERLRRARKGNRHCPGCQCYKP